MVDAGPSLRMKKNESTPPPPWAEDKLTKLVQICYHVQNIMYSTGPVAVNWVTVKGDLFSIGKSQKLNFINNCPVFLEEGKLHKLPF